MSAVQGNGERVRARWSSTTQKKQIVILAGKMAWPLADQLNDGLMVKSPQAIASISPTDYINPAAPRVSLAGRPGPHESRSRADSAPR